MISKLKCPFCQQELREIYFNGVGVGYICPNPYCKKAEKLKGNTELWQALIQSQKDLEIARKALEDMQHWLGVIRGSMISHLNIQNNTLLEHYETDPTVQNIDKAKSILKQYLEQIEHKE